MREREELCYVFIYVNCCNVDGWLILSLVMNKYDRDVYVDSIYIDTIVLMDSVVHTSYIVKIVDPFTDLSALAYSRHTAYMNNPIYIHAFCTYTQPAESLCRPDVHRKMI